MAFIRAKYKKIDGEKYGPYYYLVKSVRDGEKVKQKIVKYLGKSPELNQVPSEYRSQFEGEDPFKEN